MGNYMKRNLLKVSSGVANAIFVTIGIGYLFSTLGEMFGIQTLVIIGSVASLLLAPALGAGIAYNIGVNSLTLFAATISATLGGGAITAAADGSLTIASGDPVGALLAGTIATYVGKKVTGTSPMDMVSIPILSLLIGGLVGIGSAQVIQPMLLIISELISSAVAGSPIIGSAVMSVLFGLFLMSPVSSAALSVALVLDPVSNGAMLIGTTAQYFSFSILSMRENNLGGYVAQGICTPKVQLPNIINNPKILIGPTIASAICGPLATIVFGFETIPAMGGMGFAALVAPLWVINNLGWGMFGIYILCGAFLPVGITYSVNRVLYSKQWIHTGDMALEVN